MEQEPVEVRPLVHSVHTMTPLKDVRKGDCCGIKFNGTSHGYYCPQCDFFSHKTCSNPPQEISYPSHTCGHTLYLNYDPEEKRCCLCKEKTTMQMHTKIYVCSGLCDFAIHMDCVKYPPPMVIVVPQNHDHPLMLEMVEKCFTCDDCGQDGDGYSYKCHECYLMFHVNCKKYAVEVNHASHSMHPLKLLNGEPPSYSDGKCSLCGENVDEGFYHCSFCNFTLDLRCVLNPPPLYLQDVNIHDHKLTLLPKKISFTCTVCGLNGDRSPYVCLRCGFTSHNDCSGFPWVININRHNHRVSRTSLLGVVNSVCGVCQKKMDWSCGGYSCQKCHGYVFHTKCATREDVWDGKEMKDEVEEEDIEPFTVIDENTINHVLHKEHNLRLDKSYVFVEERFCSACAYPIYHQSFYNCMRCSFKIHESCANFPTRIQHVVSNEPYSLYQVRYGCSTCEACGVCYHGFKYASGAFLYGLDVRCASISEPFFHQSHPDHPLFYTSPNGVCSACNKKATHVLRCVEDNCGYILDFKCAMLPYVVKHRVDDHFLSLCYLGENESGKYWCDICEKETDPKTWFYTCEDCGTTLHIDCVLGDFRGIEPGKEVTTLHLNDVFSVAARNNGMSRPLCNQCKFRCLSPTILKVMEDDIHEVNYCSIKCFDAKYVPMSTQPFITSYF